MIRASACSCGGRLRAAAIEHPTLEPLFGLKGRFEGQVDGLRCDSCGAETFEGKTIERMLLTVARSVMAQPRILTPEEARFLRKAVLGISQKLLAKRMGINKTTVADWERGERALSKEHDYELRGIAMAGRIEGFLSKLGLILTGPRLAAPPRRSKPYLIPVSELVSA